MNRETSELNNITDQMDPTDICKTFHSNIEEYMFSENHGTVSVTGPIIGHKKVLTNTKKIKWFLIFWLWLNKTRNQQEKLMKICTIMEGEQHTIDWLYDRQRNEKGKKKITESSEN